MPAEALLIPRVIPCLLVDDEGLVKTVRFREPTYLGDPVNVVNLFNRFEVDEIVILDIRATVENREPPFGLIEQLAGECWVPLTYGGGVRTVEQARRVLASGVEKVVLGTAAADDPRLVAESAAEFGAQAVVVAVDVRGGGQDGYGVFVDSGTRAVGMDPAAYARRAEALGAGELFLNSIDRGGVMGGYDIELIRSVAGSVAIPVIACGGAGERADLAAAIKQGGASAVAAGSIFVFRGKQRAVLINFPEREQLEQLLA